MNSAPGPGERVLDVACGTGIVARRAAPRVGANGTVVGLDINEGMLKVVRKASSEVRPPIEWRQGNATNMRFPDGAFDIVFCQQGLQFFEDRPAALGEMHRVLVPNGRLALSVLRSVKHNPGWVHLAEAGTMMRSTFPALSIDELRDLCARAGFREVRISIGIAPVRYPSAEEFLRLEAVSSPLAGPIGALRDDVREALIQDLGEALVEYTDDNGIVFPAQTYLAVAHR